jgi:hypothetical protein
MKAYLQKQLEGFDRSILWSNKVTTEGAKVIACWFIPSFLFVLSVSWLALYRPAPYLEKAISEGYGRHLWNVVGAFGLLLFFLSLLFPRCRFIAKSAHQVLINACAIGGLHFGLLVGQFVVTDGFVVGLALTVPAVVLLFCLWYGGQLMTSREQGNGFLHKMEKVDPRLRIVLVLVMGGVTILSLFTDK